MRRKMRHDDRPSDGPAPYEAVGPPSFLQDASDVALLPYDVVIGGPLRPGAALAGVAQDGRAAVLSLLRTPIPSSERLMRKFTCHCTGPVP
jgi:hypothetical protein